MYNFPYFRSPNLDFFSLRMPMVGGREKWGAWNVTQKAMVWYQKATLSPQAWWSREETHMPSRPSLLPLKQTLHSNILFSCKYSTNFLLLMKWIISVNDREDFYTFTLCNFTVFITLRRPEYSLSQLQYTFYCNKSAPNTIESMQCHKNTGIPKWGMLTKTFHSTHIFKMY